MSVQAAFIIGVVALILAFWCALAMMRMKKAIREEAERREDYLRSRLEDLEKLLLQLRRRSLGTEIDLLQLRGELRAESPFQINDDCVACGSCVPECPTQAIHEGKIYWIDPRECISCASCAVVCPTGSCLPHSDLVRRAAERRAEAVAAS